MIPFNPKQTMRIKYKSHSDISFNIRIDGKRRHIRFESLSTGGSIYITGDPQEIEQLNHHPDCGVLFTAEPLESTPNELPASDPAIEAPSNESEAQIYAEVTSLSDAKHILKERGVPTTQLRTRASLLEAAKNQGISFPNLQ